MSRTFFVSDLHMFSRRSQVDRHEDAIRAAAAAADTMVLGGDLFDFRWSVLPSIQETVEKAVAWLANLVNEFPSCHFQYVLGNHDFNRRFIEHLANFAADKPNVDWHKYFWRSGCCVFLHGDVADRKMSHQDLISAREVWLEDEWRSRLRHRMYDAAIQMRIHKLASRIVHVRRRIAERILLYLNDIGQGPDNGVTNVYFGHTHAALADFEYGGLTFHNGGAPMKGLKFRIIEAKV